MMFWEGDPNAEVNMTEFDSSRITMKPINSSVARDIIVKHHYSHNWPAVQLSLGFYIDEKLNGVVCYGQSASYRMATALPSPDYLELVRLFSFDWAGKNMESYMIGQSIRYIKKEWSHIEVLVSFADPERDHAGTIYQATNWLYTGISDLTGTPRYKIDGKWVHPRSLGSKFGSNAETNLKKYLGKDVEVKKAVRKHRYIYFTAPKKRKRKLLKELKYDILPYPKKKEL